MATTTDTKTTYNFAITVNDGVSSGQVGRALKDAAYNMPDEPIGYAFDPFWQDNGTETEWSFPAKDGETVIGIVTVTQAR